MWYVYFLKSKNQDWRYVGSTKNLKARFRSHNDGQNKSTKPYAPFSLETYIAVKTEQKAIKLEKYFKTGSGIAWMNKHLL